MNINDVTQRQYITESYLAGDVRFLSETNLAIIKAIEEAFEPYIKQYNSFLLAEATIAPNQISQIFDLAVTKHTEITGNPGYIQKGAAGIANSIPAKLIKELNNKIDELGGAVQDTQPVKNFDAVIKRQIEKMSEALQKTSQGQSVLAALDKYRQFGAKHPIMQSVIVGLTVLAGSVAFGPLGGYAAGFVIRAGNDLIAGKSASSAIGRGLKVGAIGALAGFAIKEIGEFMADSMTVEAFAEYPEFKTLEVVTPDAHHIADKAKDHSDWLRSLYADKMDRLDSNMSYQKDIKLIEAYEQFYDLEFTFTGPPEFIAGLEDSWDKFMKEWGRSYGNFDRYPQIRYRTLITNINSMIEIEADLIDMYEGQAELNDTMRVELIQTAEQTSANLRTFAQGVQALATAAKSHSQDKDGVKESKNLNEFDMGIIDGIKSAAPALKNAIMSAGTIKPKTLQKAWQKAGSPKDSQAIRKLLSDVGIADEAIDAVYKQLEIGNEEPGPEDDPKVKQHGNGKTHNDEEMRTLAQTIFNAGLVNNAKVIHPDLIKLIGESLTPTRDIL